MIAVPNVSDWEEKFWFSTGGTRAKKYLERPGGGLFYFKRSAEKPATATKPGKYFRYEFWSEIIAHRVGVLLGFDVLEYVPAIDGERVGCLCADMINAGKEELIGGIQYLQGMMPSFDPERNEARSQYTFQLIEQALAKYNLMEFMPQIIEMIVFDSLIGNSDRHQENWAIISDFTPLTKQVNKLIRIMDKAKGTNYPRVIKSVLNRIFDFEKGSIIPEIQDHRLIAGKKRFSKLFDNGSSLGRELEEGRVTTMLHDDSAIRKYIDRGESAIHWEGQKINHFELLELLLRTDHSGIVKKMAGRARDLFDGKRLEDIIMTVDIDLPGEHEEYRLPVSRKELIIKMITSRFEILQQLCHA